MVLFDGLFGVLMLGLWLFCIIDVITTPTGAVRNLPKLLWLAIVVLLVDLGSIAWLVAGRDWTGTPRSLTGRVATRGAGRPARNRRPSNPDDDEEFLAGLRARTEEQRRRARNKDEDGATG